FGINHKSAAVEVRERVAFSPEQVPEALQDARQRLDLEEVVILSTCNRTEIYACIPDPAAGQVLQQLSGWLADYHHLSAAELAEAAYLYREESALQHLAKVASGLDSM